MACDVVMQGNEQLVGAVDLAAHLHLSGRARDAYAARSFVAAHLGGLPTEVVESAKLLVSELVGNAVLHSGGPMILGVSRAREWLLVTVADDDHAHIPHQRPAPDPEMLAESGRGFQIIAAEAADFGWRTLPGGTGKVVWF